MDAKELFKQALSKATHAVKMVDQNKDFDKPTPCAEWDIDTLVSHMIYELSWTADIVSGKTIGEVGDKYEIDIIADDLLGNWQIAAEAALSAVEICDLKATAYLSYGEATIDEYLREAASDQLIHAWDLSAALGNPIEIDTNVTEAVFSEALRRRREIAASGLFGPPLQVSEDADIQTRLLALYGRDAKWKVPQQTRIL